MQTHTYTNCERIILKIKLRDFLPLSILEIDIILTFMYFKNKLKIQLMERDFLHYLENIIAKFYKELLGNRKNN